MKLLSSAALAVFRTLHRLYKLLLSPLVGQVCRFHPSCSDYALSAVEKHGIIRGAWLAFKRIIRCNPCFDGGLDPVPDPVPKRRKQSGI